MNAKIILGLSVDELIKKSHETTRKLTESQEFNNLLLKTFSATTSQEELFAKFTTILTKEIVPIVIAETIHENNEVISKQVSELLEKK
jgi:hypothetical protein